MHQATWQRSCLLPASRCLLNIAIDDFVFPRIEGSGVFLYLEMISHPAGTSLVQGKLQFNAIAQHECISQIQSQDDLQLRYMQVLIDN
ncbi:hypothetical protein AZ66_12575 [Paenibacillus sp. E194]|nr:hypothetical protein AZ66_12575 [Paenibacillus sp. E194]